MILRLKYNLCLLLDRAGVFYVEPPRTVACAEKVQARRCEMQLDREEVKEARKPLVDRVERGIQTAPEVSGFLSFPANPIDLFKVPRSRKKQRGKVRQQQEPARTRKRVFHEENYSDRDLYELGVSIPSKHLGKDKFKR